MTPPEPKSQRTLFIIAAIVLAFFTLAYHYYAMRPKPEPAPLTEPAVRLTPPTEPQDPCSRAHYPCPEGCYQGPSSCSGTGENSFCTEDIVCRPAGYSPSHGG